MILGHPKARLPVLEWHRWFAWYPVRVSDDYVVWLEFIERRRNYFGDVLYRFTGAQIHRVRNPF